MFQCHSPSLLPCRASAMRFSRSLDAVSFVSSTMERVRNTKPNPIPSVSAAKRASRMNASETVFDMLV